MYVSNGEDGKLKKLHSSMQKQGKSSGSGAQINARVSDFFQLLIAFLLKVSRKSGTM